MLGNPWILVASQVAAALVVVAALSHAPARGTRAPDGAIELRYPAAARWASLVAPAVALVGTLAALGGTRALTLLVIGLGTVAVLVLLRVEIAGVRVRLLPDGVEQSSAFVRPRMLHWSEITSVTWRPLARGFVLEGPPGRVMISAHLAGLGEFAVALGANVALDGATAGPEVRARLAALAGRLARG